MNIGQTTVQEVHELVGITRKLWKARTVYPSPETHILNLPFSFVLPQSALPSCQFHTRRGHFCEVVYSVEVAGRCSGSERRKTISLAFKVSQSHSEGARLFNELQLGWTGSMRELEHQQMVRKGLWGEKSGVVLRVSTAA